LPSPRLLSCNPELVYLHRWLASPSEEDWYFTATFGRLEIGCQGAA